jgi:ppGpp synthetase/RelA/SpoT-type nucleotidyltranferase
MAEIIPERLKEFFAETGLIVAAVEHRVKTEGSLAGKLQLKGGKYSSIYDITDIIGLRVITFYIDDVDKVASVLERLFEIDWENSVDKRKAHETDSFGYLSLHYICRIPEKSYSDPKYPELNKIRFEVQMRTVLQHAWANMNHDTGYKSNVEIPSEYMRTLNRLAGMLELADDEFSRIRTSINDYRRKVSELVSSGRFEDVNLNGDTWRNYLSLRPFDKLTKRIAAINQAEIQHATAMPYLEIFRNLFEYKTLGDVENCLKEYGEDAYQLAIHQIGGTDIDIITDTVALQDLCIVVILENGGGEAGLMKMFETLGGKTEYNRQRSRRIIDQASRLAFMNKKK